METQTTTPSWPYLVYLDNTFLIDLADPTENRHQGANRAFDIFRRHVSTQLLQVRTSMWAMAEAQSVLYKSSCGAAGIVGPARGGSQSSDVRYLMPPDAASMTDSSSRLAETFKMLMDDASLSILPDPGADSNSFWTLVNKLVRGGMFFPNDCVHLAFALQEGCSLILTDDYDFQEKVDYLQSSLIQPYRAQQFPYITDLPAFHACGLRNRPRQRPPRLTVFQVLNQNQIR